MRKNIILTLAFLVILSIFIGGCTSTTQLSTIDPSIMALSSTEVPSGFTQLGGSSMTSSDIKQMEPSLGGEKGYYVNFISYGKLEVIHQTIIVYDLVDPMTKGLANAGYEILNTEQANATVTVTQLPDPGMGDSSQAFMTITKSAGIQLTRIDIIFVKDDVFEDVVGGGTSADYETLKELATVAASKIR